MNKRAFLALGVVAIGVAGIGYSMTGNGDAGWEHRYLTVDEMKASGALIVDIRTPPEWAQTGVIDGAELVTFEGARGFAATFLDALGDQITDGREIILVCRSGNRTQAAAGALAAVITNPIVSIEGGIKRLMREGYQPVPVH